MIGVSHFKIISENLVIFNLQIFNSGPLPVMFFQLRQPLLAVPSGAAQHVYGLIKTIPDHASLPDGHRRFLLNSLFNQLKDILQTVNLLLHIYKLLTAKALQNLFYGRKHLQRIPKGDKVPGVGGFVGHLAKKPLQIIYRVQIFPQFIPGNTVLVQLLHRIQTLFHFLLIYQGLLQHTAQQPPSHSGPGFIQNPQQ